MDQNPWTYRIMGEELTNENRYEFDPDPLSDEISDIRNYVYIEYEGSTDGTNIELGIELSLISDCKKYLHHHNSDVFSHQYYGGIHRTSIELPEGFDPSLIFELGFISNGNTYNVTITEISRLFYLDNNYNLVDIELDFNPFTLDSNNKNFWFSINQNLLNIDCHGIIDGSGECDDCDVCDGENTNLDQCNICFGNNINMDCNGECFGMFYEDECGVCDDNINNDNITCSGCTDINAENYYEDAIFDDGSCIYSFNIFQVPSDYYTIQNAINYANNGDTIEVAAGTYYENIDFLEKSLFIRSEYMNENEIDDYVISGIDSLPVVTIKNIDSGGSALMGFTITNGYGGGISFDDFISMAADEQLFDSLITNVIEGGGISIVNASPLLKDLKITSNSSRNAGAGIGLVNSNAIIESSIIAYNTIPDGDALGGGGIAINGGYPTLKDLDISNNFVGTNLYYLNGGGGIFCGFSFGDNSLEVDIENSVIRNNSANIGAGIGALSGLMNLDRVLIYQNTGEFGSAISMGEPLGLILGQITMNMVNSTISANSGQMSIALINTSLLNAHNSIFWNNSNLDFNSLPNNNELNVNINYSILANEWDGINNLVTDPFS